MYLFLSLIAMQELFIPSPDRPIPEIHANIVYKEVDGERLMLDVFQPVNAVEPTPVVIFLHGGGWFLRDRTDFYSFGAGFGMNGYASVMIEWRDLPPNGFYDQVTDIKDAIRWVRLHAEEYNIDPSRVGISGASSGAHMAAIVATTGDGEGLGDDPPGTDSTIQSAVYFEGVYDLLGDHKDVTKILFWFFTNGPRLLDAPELFEIFSPIYNIDGSEPPSLMIYGTKDDIVPTGQPQRFAEALVAKGVPGVTLPFPGGHGFNQFRILTRPLQTALALAWFESTL